jgi:hypothetical protein
VARSTARSSSGQSSPARRSSATRSSSATRRSLRSSSVVRCGPCSSSVLNCSGTCSSPQLAAARRSSCSSSLARRSSRDPLQLVASPQLARRLARAQQLARAPSARRLVAARWHGAAHAAARRVDSVLVNKKNSSPRSAPTFCWAFCAKRCRRPWSGRDARSELFGTCWPTTATSKCYAVTTPNGERTTAVTMDTSPTSSNLGNLALQPDEYSRQRGAWLPRMRLGSEKSTI